ncbi:ATPase inhibitor subunit zeta [Rickettsiales endosymbiont of Stachyamoeba lipophora]|uniref:ATPase inhibitor subunit zeta n=1 Tax=Rickettsiales endosymbiont of Stachyamoeba lipophora TaxID=2486578 RepID=UPI000F64FEFF|nr:ATPase inhibitor subunit zeta [Rickettsiales endosymbiont of Stachyamoeba lipophora]AZL16292.1 DUF1476 domain-containing protein [Rickettsiales endosymbiont of Stachyamoeba lipophora]
MHNKSEQAQENKFANDQKAEYQVQSARNKLLGKWAGSIMYTIEQEIEKYIEQLIVADLEEPSDNDIITKIFNDLNTFGYQATREEIKEKIIEFNRIAVNLSYPNN